MNSALIESVYQEAVSGIEEALLIAPHPALYKYVMNLPLPKRLTYVIVVFHNQILNGGFDQYFFNAYGQFAYETIDYLQLIKAFSQASILNKAIQHLRIKEPNRERLIAKIANGDLSHVLNSEEGINNYLEKLNIEYDTCSEDLEQLLFSFLVKDVV